MTPAPPEIAVVMPASLRDKVFPGPAADRLARFGRVRLLEDVGGLADGLPDVQILVAGWGLPPLTAALLDGAPRLRLIAYVGAAVKGFVTPAVFDRGLTVTQAGQGMARPVAEVALTFTLALLHQVHRFDHALRSGADWAQATLAPPRHEILGSTIGVVGASRTGRAYLALVRSLGATALVHDPYLTEQDAATIGAESVPLQELLRRSRVTALHAPTLPETRRLIGTRELALLPDGAGLVNTARSWLVDPAALLAELRTGRIDAAIDVFDDEPLPADDPLRSLPNVLLTPHQAAGTEEGRARQGQVLLEEIQRHLDGAALQHAITPDLLRRSA